MKPHLEFDGMRILIHKLTSAEESEEMEQSKEKVKVPCLEFEEES